MVKFFVKICVMVRGIKVVRVYAIDAKSLSAAKRQAAKYYMVNVADYTKIVAEAADGRATEYQRLGAHGPWSKGWGVDRFWMAERAGAFESLGRYQMYAQCTDGRHEWINLSADITSIAAAKSYVEQLAMNNDAHVIVLNPADKSAWHKQALKIRKAGARMQHYATRVKLYTGPGAFDWHASYVD